MIVVTGAAGFIGSALCATLNSINKSNLIIVDKFDEDSKEGNWRNLAYAQKIDRSNFIEWFDAHFEEVHFVYHLGARTDTTEFDKDIFDELNLNYSKAIWERCMKRDIPLVYASSAATYGSGEEGYDDDEDKIPNLKPLNPYGQSKQDFDMWVLNQEQKLSKWAGLKFFNVFGPNEYHKGRMASVVFHAFKQIRETGMMKLFRSHNPDYKDGEQMRDFVYIKDVVSVLVYFLEASKFSGIFNLGSGEANTFKDLVSNVFRALDLEERIEFIDTPQDIRDKYQYFTKAEMSKLRENGFTKKFMSFDASIHDYVVNYLSGSNNY